MMVSKNCAACGCPIKVRLVDHKRGWGRFCDKACSAAFKCGQRPRDVNRTHAKSSPWAADRLAEMEAAGGWEKAPSIEEQLGKRVKVKHVLHSPEKSRVCVECGNDSRNEKRCDLCSAVDDTEAGWDGHKS